MKIKFYNVSSQLYITPYVKITYDKFLNGDYELIIGWFNQEMVISI
tara:strand:+ start:42 stop:179 length:138 start_codon:yes stop_codon:yes gene_type:complete